MAYIFNISAITSGFAFHAKTGDRHELLHRLAEYTRCYIRVKNSKI